MTFTERFSTDGGTQRKQVAVGTIEDISVDVEMVDGTRYTLTNSGAYPFVIVEREDDEDPVFGASGVSVKSGYSEFVKKDADEGLFIWPSGPHPAYVVINESV